MNTAGVKEYTCPNCKEPFTRLERSTPRLILGVVIILLSIPGILFGIALVFTHWKSEPVSWIFVIAPALFALLGLNFTRAKFCPNCSSKMGNKRLAAPVGGEAIGKSTTIGVPKVAEIGKSVSAYREQWWTETKELFKDGRAVILALLLLAYVIGIALKVGALKALFLLLTLALGAYLLVKNRAVFKGEYEFSWENLPRKDRVLIVLFVSAIIIMGVMGIVLAVMGLLSFMIGALIFVYNILPKIMLPVTGVSIQGVVDDLELAEHFSGSSYSMYNVYYRFETPSGEVIPANTNLSKRAFASLVKGQSVRVFYDPKHPEVNRLADYRQWWTEYLVISGVLIFCLVSVLILYFCI